MSKPYYKTPEERLMNRRRITESGCWEYVGGTPKHRKYPQVTTTVGKHRAAHLVAAQLWMGVQPNGTIVCHECDNNLCFNPDHLYFGTYEDNSRDMIERNRGSMQIKSEDVRGTKHPNNKLTEDEVRQIREMVLVTYFRGMYSAIASQFNTTIQNVYRIKKGKCWAWLK
jgi:hypothetical protein